MRRPGLTLWLLLFCFPLCAQNLKLERSIPFSEAEAVRFTAISPKGNFLAAACKDARVRLWTYPGLELKQSFDLLDERIAEVKFSRDGSLLAVAGNRGKVRIWSLPSGKLKWELAIKADINALAISPDMNMLAVAPADKPGELWDLRLVRLAASLPTNFSGSLALDFSPDGKWLASADADTGIRFYDGQTGAPRATNNDLLLESFAAAFSADSKYLYVGGADKTISVLEVATAKLVRALPKQTFVVRILDASPDGKSLAAAYADEHSFDNPAPVLVWDLATQAVRTTVLQEGVQPNGGGFLPDGRLLLTSNGKGRTEVWAVK